MKNTTTALVAIGLLAWSSASTEPPTAGAISSPAGPRAAADDAPGASYTPPPIEKANPCVCSTCTDCKCEQPGQCQVSAAAPVACAFVTQPASQQPVLSQPTGHYESRPAGLFGRRSVQVWVPNQIGRSTFGQVYSGCSSCGGS